MYIRYCSLPTLMIKNNTVGTFKKKPKPPKKFYRAEFQLGSLALAIDLMGKGKGTLLYATIRLLTTRLDCLRHHSIAHETTRLLTSSFDILRQMKSGWEFPTVFSEINTEKLKICFNAQ